MARKKRPHRVRPKTPSRVKKRTRRASRGHQHPELIGLGLAAFGLFMGSVLYAGWNGGYVGKAIGDGVVALVGGMAYVLPVAFVAYLPAAVLMGRTGTTGVPAGLAYASPAVGLVLYILARYAWYRALRRYESVGG